MPDGIFLKTTESKLVKPLGLSAYAGIGYGFGSNQDFSLGFEAAASWAVSVKPSGDSNSGGRIFAKYGPLEPSA